jgi:hypothetical protein
MTELEAEAAELAAQRGCNTEDAIRELSAAKSRQ